MNLITPHADAAAALAAQAKAARSAAHTLARLSPAVKEAGLRAAAAAIRRQEGAILEANARDLAAVTDRPASFVDRLTLTPARLEAMARGVEEVAALPDPVGAVLAEWTRPNGLRIRRVATPLGVIGMIFESRPNVAADAAAIAVKSGNALILRGGSESLASVTAIHAAITEGFAEAGLPEASVQVAPTADRAYVAAMLAGVGLVDVIIPRGGKGLVERVQAEARVPVLAHAEGRCHTFVHRAADLAKARAIVVNAKLRRTGVCGATETLLVDRAVAETHLPPIIADLAARGCSFRADPAARAICPELPAANAEDFDTEWLDAVLSVAVVDGVEGAIAHILRHGSEHTDAIITEDAAAAEAFLAGIDSAIGIVNASTQFADGGEFGFGAEIGIATGRIHARGPVGPQQLTTFRYHVYGTGQIRP
jgi:glutamate-5-semialdehyde dehydrogenase